MSCIIIQLVNQTQKTQRPIQQFQETNTQPQKKKKKKKKNKRKNRKKVQNIAPQSSKACS